MKKLTDLEKRSLHQKFMEFGCQRNKITYELLNLLPEIFSQKIYRDYGCETIVEYAGKFAGLTAGVVKKCLNLEKHLENKPALKEAIKTQGIHKVAMVATLATPQNEAAWADKVKNMSKPAVQELVKEIRMHGEGQCKALQKITIQLDDEMQFMFLKFKNKNGKNLSNKEAMRKMLKIVNGKTISSGKKLNKIKTQKTKVVPSLPGERVAATKEDWLEFLMGAPRYVRVAIKNESLEKTKGRCGYPSCNKPPDVTHHRNRYATSKSHDSIISLCKAHHEFMHNGLISNEIQEPSRWKLKLGLGVEVVDQLYRSNRVEALAGVVAGASAEKHGQEQLL